MDHAPDRYCSNKMLRGCVCVCVVLGSSRVACQETNCEFIVRPRSREFVQCNKSGPERGGSELFFKLRHFRALSGLPLEPPL